MNERTFDQLLEDFRSFWNRYGEQISSFCKLQLACMLTRPGHDIDQIIKSSKKDLIQIIQWNVRFGPMATDYAEICDFRKSHDEHLIGLGVSKRSIKNNRNACFTHSDVLWMKENGKV